VNGHRVENGFTLTELIVAMCVSMIVCGALVVLANEARTIFRVQPETVDLLQRARVGHELLADELSAAGAGITTGRDAEPLVHWIPPVLPSADGLTIITIPDMAPQASIDGMTSSSGDIVPIVRDGACGVSDLACGFAEGQRVLLFDASPAFDIATVRGVSPSTVRLDAGSASKTYRAADDAHIAAVRVTTFSFDPVRHQLRRGNGDGTEDPALDAVAELSFRYFADPYPPESPRPPPGEANCLFDASGLPRLPAPSSGDGSLIELLPASLADGPFCGTFASRFDADLYRLRRVHVRLRVQAASDWLRGLGSRLLPVPDMVVEFDVAPRALQVR
jgi:hypothetical protein